MEPKMERVNMKEKSDPVSLLIKQIEKNGWVKSVDNIEEIKDLNQAMELARFLAPNYTSGFDDSGEGSSNINLNIGKDKGTYFEQNFQLRLMSYHNKLYLDIGSGRQHKKIFDFNNEEQIKEIISLIPKKERI